MCGPKNCLFLVILWQHISANVFVKETRWTNRKHTWTYMRVQNYPQAAEIYWTRCHGPTYDDFATFPPSKLCELWPRQIRDPVFFDSPRSFLIRSVFIRRQPNGTQRNFATCSTEPDFKMRVQNLGIPSSKRGSQNCLFKWFYNTH